eukprot:EG_transcript_6631
MSVHGLPLPRPFPGVDLVVAQPRSNSYMEEGICPTRTRGIRGVWIICVLVLAIAAVSALPLMGISIIQTNNLGSTLLQEMAEQQFNVMQVTMQAALDEGDYWANFMEGWLRHHPPPLLAKDLEADVRMLMLTFLTSVAKRVGGMCLHFVNEISTRGGWQYCGARITYQGNIEYHWENVPNTSMFELRTDKYFNVLEPVVSWPLPASDYTKPQFQWPDGRVEWEQPSSWNQEGQIITEVVQHRMVKVGNTSILNRFWMEGNDWAQVLRDNLNASIASNPKTPPIAFMFSDAGVLITSTCGATNRKELSAVSTKASDQQTDLIYVTESDCDLVRQTYAALDRDGYLKAGSGFYRANLASGPYLLGLRQIQTSKSGPTPYYLASAYPFEAVDEPVRWTITMLVVVCVCTVCFTIVAASFVTTHIIDRPLREVALGLDRCVELDVYTTFSRTRTPIKELCSIQDSLEKVKGTLQAVTKFVPVPVVQRSLRLGESIVMSMVPAQASIMFLDIKDFTSLTEAMEIGKLVSSVAAFFERLSDIVVSHNGVIDKYIGDCLMAFWNMPQSDPHHQLHACQAALACSQAMDHPHPDVLPLTGRIGLEAGPVYAGLFGSRHRMNYTVVGDVVN